MSETNIVANSDMGKSKRKTFFDQSKDSAVSRTNQSLRRETDINMIMERVKSRMVNLPVNSKTPMYGDFSNVPSYAEALNTVIRVKNYFNSLSAQVRSYFNNDPQALLSFMDDPKNLSEAVRLGLIPRDLSQLRYVDKETGEDLTDVIYNKRGFFVGGVRVDRNGKPLTKEQLKALENLNNDSKEGA